MGSNKKERFAIDCGDCCLCCKGLDRFKGFNFPYEILPNGDCSKLVNGKCSVYDERPEICNITELRKYYNMSDDEYIKFTEEMCRKLKLES
jgi:hypothetical protein